MQLVTVLAPLSLVAVGGGNSVLPDIHRQVVTVHGWMTDTEFADAFTLAQTVPGPNLLVVSLIGWHVAGLAGAAVSTLAIIGPSSLLALVVSRGLASQRAAFWRKRLQVGLAPMTIGLVLASGVVLRPRRRRRPGDRGHDGRQRAGDAAHQAASARADRRRRGDWRGACADEPVSARCVGTEPPSISATTTVAPSAARPRA
jgi:chromate transporter